MKILWGALVVGGSGKLGGHVGARNRAGAYLRTKTTPINPQTDSQQGVRNNFATNSQSWRGLTEVQRDAWNASVEDFKKTDVFGSLKTPSGFNLYMRLNNNLLAAGVAVITDPPLPQDIFAFTTLSVIADTTGGTLIATFTAAIPAGSSVLVFATPGVSAGKSFVKNEFRQISVKTVADVSPEDLAAEYIVKFGALPTAGKKVFIGLKVVNDTSGQAGVLLTTSDIAV